MSIYPVRFSEWFPKRSDQHETALSLTNVLRCYACAKKVRFDTAVGHHSLPWGCGELWCSWECCESGKHKIAKPDKRYERRIKRSEKQHEKPEKGNQDEKENS